MTNLAINQIINNLFFKKSDFNVDFNENVRFKFNLNFNNNNNNVIKFINFIILFIQFFTIFLKIQFINKKA